MWVIWSLVANAAVLSSEYIFRAGMFRSFLAGWWIILPLAVVSAFALFHSYRGAPTYLVGWAVFFAVNATGRIIVNNYILHESVGTWAWVGLMAIWAGGAIMRLR